MHKWSVLIKNCVLLMLCRYVVKVFKEILHTNLKVWHNLLTHVFPKLYEHKRYFFCGLKQHWTPLTSIVWTINCLILQKNKHETTWGWVNYEKIFIFGWTIFKWVWTLEPLLYINFNIRIIHFSFIFTKHSFIWTSCANSWWVENLKWADWLRMQIKYADIYKNLKSILHKNFLDTF